MWTLNNRNNFSFKMAPMKNSYKSWEEYTFKKNRNEYHPSKSWHRWGFQKHKAWLLLWQELYQELETSWLKTPRQSYFGNVTWFPASFSFFESRVILPLKRPFGRVKADWFDLWPHEGIGLLRFLRTSWPWSDFFSSQVLLLEVSLLFSANPFLATSSPISTLPYSAWAITVPSW